MNPPDRPLVTFALFAYNQEEYIQQAVEGAFAQTYTPLEIILSDDSSSDRTYEIIQGMAAAYTGPHTIHLRQSEVNKGLANHVNAVSNLAEGEIIVLAAGDDISLPTRVTVSVDLLETHKDATAVLLSAIIIDKNGSKTGQRFAGGRESELKIQTLDDLISLRYTTFGASRAIRSEIFKIFGDLQINCPTEDTPLLLRSLICGSNVLSSEIGISYRVHDKNLSNLKSLASMNIEAIYAQYEEDISRAVILSLVGPKKLKSLRKWVFQDNKSRQIKLKIGLRAPLSVGEWMFILMHRPFHLKETIKIAYISVFRKV
jgi:glycosyltransferase involved in cell wall biosynthesis